MIRYPAMILATCVAILSAYLTFCFTEQIGGSLGFPIAMGLMGLCLEGAKAMFPVCSVMLHRQGKHTQAVLFAAVTVVIMAVSFSASMSTFTSGVNKASSQGDEYISLSNQIERLERTVISDLDSGYRSRALKTEATINDLTNRRANITSQSFVGEYGYKASVVISALVEIIGVMLMIVSVNNGNKPNQVENNRINSDHNGSVSPEVAIIEVPEQIIETKQISFAAKESVEEQIRNAVVTKSVERPSVSCLRANGYKGISSQRMSKVLHDLCDLGVLVPRGNKGFKYA